jgi:hypothetical protein
MADMGGNSAVLVTGVVLAQRPWQKSWPAKNGGCPCFLPRQIHRGLLICTTDPAGTEARSLMRLSTIRSAYRIGAGKRAGIIQRDPANSPGGDVRGPPR